jgi:Transposase IS116/IS110/IS902 family
MRLTWMRFVAATMLTEAAGPLADRNYDMLRAHTGVAPVTKRSGKRAFFVHMRYACKWRLRQALYHWSRISIQHDAAARAYYDRLRARGHNHARALRSVADRWLRILVAMLTTGNLYDPSRFASVTADK